MSALPPVTELTDSEEGNQKKKTTPTSAKVKPHPKKALPKKRATPKVDPAVKSKAKTEPQKKQSSEEAAPPKVGGVLYGF